MSKKNIYQEDIIVSDKLDEYLKKCFLNHLIIYNYSLEILIKNPTIKFKDLKLKCYEFISKKKIIEFISSPFFNELHYQYKKFNNQNIKSGKTLTGIHYITFLVNSYNNKCFNKDNNRLTINNIDGFIELNKDLPEIIDSSKLFYFNISYSNQESKYQLSIFQ